MDRLDVRPGDRILEIGCGYGHCIGLVCERLTSGKITAIDRSAKMAEAAKRANAPYLHTGRAEVLHRDILDSRLPSSSFDSVFLFNINAFWMDPVSELTEVKRLLAPQGRFYIFHKPPPGHDVREFIERFNLNLQKNGFEIVTTEIASLEGTEAACVVSSPNPQ